MNTATITRDETLELRLKALRLPSFLEQYIEWPSVRPPKAGATCDISLNW